MMEHEQTDSGLGFACDVGVLEAVRALWAAGMVTDTSCEAAAGEVGNMTAEAREVWFLQVEPARLFAFCLALRWWLMRQTRSGDGWSLSVVMDAWMDPPEVAAVLRWLPQLDALILQAIGRASLVRH